MNRNDITARADAPDATPVPASRTSGTPLGTTHFLTLAAAKKAADIAMSSALAKGYPVSVTVVDRDGSYSVLAERHGWSFIDQLLASSPQFVNGHLGVAQGLAAGTAALSFDHIISLGAADRRAGRLAVTIPAEDPMPAWPQNAAILDGSPSPAAAKLFLRWLLEPDQQNAIAQGGAWSPRLDIAPPPGQAPLAELNVANGSLAFITRTADAQAYRDRFAALIGPVTGPEYR